MWLIKNIASKSDKESSIQIKSLRQLTEKYPEEFHDSIESLIQEFPVLQNNIKQFEMVVELGKKSFENNFSFSNLFENAISPLLKANPELLKTGNEEQLRLLVGLGIKAAENKFNPNHLFEYGISPLLKANPELAKTENKMQMEQVGKMLLELGIKAVVNGFNSGCLFKFALIPLLKASPELTKMENKMQMEQLGKMFLELGIKAVEAEYEPISLFRDGIFPLFEANPELIKIENEELLRLIVELGIKTVENKFNPYYLFVNQISPLLKANPELAKTENKMQLALLLDWGIKMAKNKLDPDYLLGDVIPGLFKVNPKLAKLENIEYLKSFGDLLLELGIESPEKNKIEIDGLFREGVSGLIEANPELVKIENGMPILLILRLGVRAAKNKFNPRCFFECGLNTLLKANPGLAGKEKQTDLKEFAILLLKLGVKAVRSKAEPFDLFESGISELIRANPELARIENKNHLEEFGKMLLELEIKAVEYGLNPDNFIEREISPLLKANPELSKIGNKNHLKEFGEMFLEFEKIIFENITLITGVFRSLVRDLIKSNPELAKIENKSHLAVFGKLLLELGAKAVKNKLHANDFFKELSELIKANPELAKLKNLKILERYADSILTIFLNTNDHNRARIADLINNNFSKFNLEQTESLLKLLEKIILKYPRIAYPVFEGVFVAINQGVLPKDLTLEDESRILEFIVQTNSFEPVFYKAYEKHGQHFISALKKSGQNILTDQFTEADLEKLSSYFTGDKNEVTLALIQTKIPLSGASFVSKEEALGLYKGMSAAGDLKKHIPLYWQNKEIEKEIEVFEMKVKEGEEVDKEGKVKKVIELLRDKNHPSKDDVLKELTHYLEKGQNDPGSLDQLENKQIFLETFLRYAGQKDLLGEKIDRLANKDYYTLRILEEISKDKDNLPTLLKELLAEIEQTNPQLLKVKSEYQKISNVDHLLKHINKNLPKLPSEDMRIKALSKILMKYDPREIEKLLIPKVKERDLAVLIKIVIAQENASLLSQSKMIDKLLADQIASIRHELLKFENVSKEENLKLGFRVVKGLPYTMWGLNAGVCIARDVELWKNPSFKLISIIDKNSQNVGGFIHVFETEINGKKILTVPGIEPSVEFLNNVDPSALYDQIEDVLKEFAKLGGYDAVYIPTSPNINSNRTDIQKAIQKKKYQIMKLSERVNWNNVPSPYPFDEVYVIPVSKR